MLRELSARAAFLVFDIFYVPEYDLSCFIVIPHLILNCKQSDTMRDLLEYYDKTLDSGSGAGMTAYRFCYFSPSSSFPQRQRGGSPFHQVIEIRSMASPMAVRTYSITSSSVSKEKRNEAPMRHAINTPYVIHPCQVSGKSQPHPYRFARNQYVGFSSGDLVEMCVIRGELSFRPPSRNPESCSINHFCLDSGSSPE